MVNVSADKCVCPNASSGSLKEGLTSHVGTSVKT